MVLTRKPNETIVIPIGDVQIVITLVQSQDNKARIGIDAPRDIPIFRGEVHERMKEV